MSQIEIWSMIANAALTYIFVAIATSNAQKQTVLDQKVDLRTTKEDIMAEIKEVRTTVLDELKASGTKSSE